MDNEAALTALRAPFAESQINVLPKPYKKDSTKGNCKECGGYHGLPAAHLPYVGHAALTARLLDVDPEWTWEPLATGDDGLPVFDRNGGLWIRLTVAGVTRLGYGDAQGKQGGNAVKEAIGDCLVTGTPILTDHGVLPIEAVRVGHRVPTRSGWHTVTDHWLSTEAAPVMAVLIDDGRVLVGTPHHKIPTARGPVSVRELRNGDMLYAWQATESPQTPKTSSGTAESTDDYPVIPNGTDVPTSWPRQAPGATSTAISTVRRTESSLMAGTCTIETTIPTTTTRRTWPQSHRELTQSTITRRVSRWSIRAITAATSSLQSRERTTSDGAALDARQLPAELLDWSHLDPASRNLPCISTVRSVEQDSNPLSRGRDSAQPRVVAVLDAGVGQVWNLSVEGVHEYVANGIYVHNSLRNAAMRFGAALDLWHKGDLYDGAGAQTGEDSTRDWVAEAEALTTADAVLNVWKEAKANGAPLESLDKISVIGRERREAEGPTDG